MTTKRVDGFFYGLFMDSDLLRADRIFPENPRRAYVDDFELRIGQRATLIRRIGARSYGMIFALTQAEIDRMYAGPGLAQYRPETVTAQPFHGEAVPALCYNLIEAPTSDESNAEYAAHLREVLDKLGFPQSYIRSVE
ncbi:MAG: hypothetical protein ACWGPN_12840 [Gammaproteobacteria bacterium]